MVELLWIYLTAYHFCNKSSIIDIQLHYIKASKIIEIFKVKEQIITDFLLRSAQNCKKCTFSDNLKTITWEGNMGTRQLTPFFLSTFSNLTVCNIHFWIWKYSKFIFMWSPLWCTLVCKIPQFFAKSYWFGQLIILF